MKETDRDKDLEQKIIDAVKTLHDLCEQTNKAMLIAIATEHADSYEYQISNTGFKSRENEERIFVPVQTAAAMCCFEPKTFKENYQALLHITRECLTEHPEIMEKVARQQMKELLERAARHGNDDFTNPDKKEKTKLH